MDEGGSVGMIKVDNVKVVALADVIKEAITKHLDKTPMTAAEIQLALTQVIYGVGIAVNLLEQEEALREKPRVAA